jgi:hypothetical protein
VHNLRPTPCLGDQECRDIVCPVRCRLVQCGPPFVVAVCIHQRALRDQEVLHAVMNAPQPVAIDLVHRADHVQLRRDDELVRSLAGIEACSIAEFST